MADADDKSLVEYECREHIATITLNRPDKLNAVNDDMVRQISAALQRFDSDNDARVAILCGRGRAFSSGADVHQRQLRSRARNLNGTAARRRRMHRATICSCAR